MTDLDFDEIDRAVNELTNSSSVNNSGVGDSTPPATEPVKNNTTSPTPSASRPSTGQFMDVVHPSSDMRRGTLKMPERPAINKSEPVADLSSNPTFDNQKSSTTDEAIVKNDAETDQLVDSESQLPDSPFLSDAKVEKRPLGAFSAVSPEDTADKETSDVQPALTDEQIPDDIQDDLQKVESDGLAVNVDEQSVSKKEVEDAIKTVDEDQKTESMPVSTSIVQQYKEKPTTGDQTSGSIYDTESYHKPLVKPAGKKSGWLWVVWIILLLVVGAGAGAGFYFFILPLL